MIFVVAFFMPEVHPLTSLDQSWDSSSEGFKQRSNIFVSHKRRLRREEQSTKYGVRRYLIRKKRYILFWEMSNLGHSAVLYLLFVKSFIVAYDGQLRITLIILWPSYFLFIKSWLKSNYIWAPGWATAQVALVLNTLLDIMSSLYIYYLRASSRE